MMLLVLCVAVVFGFFAVFILLSTNRIIVAAADIIFRVNLPVSVATVWITNPITMPPMFYAAYWVGALLLNIPPDPEAFDFSLDAIMSSLGGIWQPFLLGCAILGASSSALGYIFARLLWRWIIVKRWFGRNN